MGLVQVRFIVGEEGGGLRCFVMKKGFEILATWHYLTGLRWSRHGQQPLQPTILMNYNWVRLRKRKPKNFRIDLIKICNQSIQTPCIVIFFFIKNFKIFYITYFVK